MAAIKVSKYETIAQLYANAQIQIQGVSSYYYDAAYEILQADYFDPELDLLQPFYTAYLSVQTLFNQTPAAVVTAVGALQAHILSKARTQDGAGKYTNINYWLESDNTGNDNYSSGIELTTPSRYGRSGDSNDAKVTVPTQFASISAQAGYSIDAGNIT